MWQPQNSVEQERLNKVLRLEELGIETYPRRANPTHSTAQALHLIEDAEATRANPDDELPDIPVTVVGRIRRMNVKGKISFMHIEDEEGRIQLFLRVNNMQDNAYMLVREKLIEVDDFVQATGTMMRTRAGEASILVNEFTLLAKSLSPLPVVKQQVLDDGTVKEYGEFSDVETRYRQRYADLAVNHDVRDVFRKRATVLRSMRQFLDNEGMLEVETPVLQPIYGGAAARPFVTHHNQLGQDLFLRISFELYLKRLIVGGYDAVYEIGRDFRNEGVSAKHNPEFTMMEFYKAYIDYHGVMDITERMVAYIAEQVHGTTDISYQGEILHLAPSWKRITMRDAIIEHLNIDVMDYPDAESMTTLMQERFNEKVKPGDPWGRIVVEQLFGNHVEPLLIQPTFIMDHPRDVSPFAKRTETDERFVERFELFIAGRELGNAFTEINDPRDQEARFHEMASLYQQGDDDETPIDEDYLRAMRYGMPPVGGFGIGVDRLVMLLTDQRNIKDVLLFPHLRIIE